MGAIHQTYTPGTPVEKGAEKGYFAFGGSSTITIFEPGAVKLDADLLEQSSNQTELYARMQRGSDLEFRGANNSPSLMFDGVAIAGK